MLIPDLVSILEPTVYFSFTLKKPRQKNISANGAWQLGSAKFPVELIPAAAAPVSVVGPRVTGNKPVSARGFILKASFDDISIADLKSKFHFKFLPSEIRTFLINARLLDFSIKKPSISIPIGMGGGGFQMQVSGRPQIGGWSGVTLNALLTKGGNGKVLLALGLEFAETGFAGLIKKLTGVKVKFISFLDQSLKCAIVISPRTMQGVALQGEVLSQVSIVRGLSIVGMFSFPPDCRSDLFCKFMEGVLGSDASMTLKSTISSPKQITIEAAVKIFEIGGGIILRKAALEFKIGTETSVGLVATLKLKNPRITFRGAIRVGTQGLELSMTMVGIWKKAFGLDWLAFGNGILSIALKPGVPLVGFAVGLAWQKSRLG